MGTKNCFYLLIDHYSGTGIEMVRGRGVGGVFDPWQMQLAVCTCLPAGRFAFGFRLMALGCFRSLKLAAFHLFLPEYF